MVWESGSDRSLRPKSFNNQLLNYLLALFTEVDEKTAGSSIIPDTAKEKPMEGEVIAVGPGARDENGRLVSLDV